MRPIRTQSASLSDSGVRKSANWLNKAIERGMSGGCARECQCWQLLVVAGEGYRSGRA